MGLYIWVFYGFFLRTHPLHGESHIQHNVNWEVAKTSLLFTTNHTDCTFFLWRLHLAWPSHHHGHSTILLRSESPSGKCAKLHTVAATNNRDYHLTRSLIACLRHIRVCVLFFVHIIPFVVNCTLFNATSTERLQQYAWISAWSLSHDLTPNLNHKPQLETSTQNLNPKLQR